MKLKELVYFFEGYSIPYMRDMYPTNKLLWEEMKENEGKDILQNILVEIEWILSQDNTEKEQIMEYLNEVGIMGPIHFDKVNEMILFLTEMKIGLTLKK